LIPRGYVDAAGVPRADLFWGLEDTEYVHFRPPRYGYHAILWPAAEAVINTKRSSRSIAGWKYYYLARNAVFLNLYDRPDVPLGSRLKRLTRGLRDLTRRLRNDPSERLAKCALFARGVWHGIVRRLGRTVVPTDADRPIE
jgi:GT2 family glycosyltransferase